MMNRLVNLAPTPSLTPASMSNVLASPHASTTDFNAARNHDSPLGSAIATMSEMLALLNILSNRMFDDIQLKTQISRDAQDMANKVEQALSKIQDPTKDSQAVPADVVKYMRDNGILVSGRSIDQFLDNNSGKELNKGDLSAVKAALESVSGRASDFVQTSQLKIQQIMQTYNITISMINSMQSMGAEANKSIAQAIR
jgi:secreted effector protein SseB